jgi:hypothetical protein
MSALLQLREEAPMTDIREPGQALAAQNLAAQTLAAQNLAAQTLAAQNLASQDKAQGRVGRALRSMAALGPAGLCALVRRHGLGGSLDFLRRNLRYALAERLARRWDRRHGVDTAGSIPLEGLDVVGPNRAKGNECVCTSPKSFAFIMRQIGDIPPGTTFIDIGSGKARTLLLASHHPFARIVGVEFARELAAVARDNIAAYRAEDRRTAALEVVEGDAAAFAFPATPLVVYFYNPFSKDVFDEVLANLVASLRTAPRPCILVYGSSSHRAIDWARPAILASGAFEAQPTPPMPGFLDAVRRIDAAIFRFRA